MPHVVGVVCSCGFKSTVESSIHIANILAPEGITRVISRYVYLTNQPRKSLSHDKIFAVFGKEK